MRKLTIAAANITQAYGAFFTKRENEPIVNHNHRLDDLNTLVRIAHLPPMPVLKP